MSDPVSHAPRHAQMFELLRQKERAQEVSVHRILRRWRQVDQPCTQTTLKERAIDSLRRA